jgi:hypothetical protein
MATVVAAGTVATGVRAALGPWLRATLRPRAVGLATAVILASAVAAAALI